MTGDEEERARRDALHDIENWARKQPRQPGQPPPDPVHLIRVSQPGQPSRYGLCTWSLAARLSRDAAAIGKAAEITDLGTAAIDIDPAAFADGTRIMWLRRPPEGHRHGP